ncbi:MAG: hypothetical protein DRP64_14730 [Verrucomicrobia bacterium]|nr:MAG: hypothetical protein DRP64_14730 [Verrucomicrobiota bacterium]
MAPPDAPNLHGVRRPGWVLAEHTLPEQSRVAVFSGRFRIVRSSFEESPFLEQELADPALADWNALLHQNKSLTIPANRQVTAIWDLDQYACGYPQFGWSKGAGATVEVEWAESLYQGGHSDEVDAFSPKGNRSELAKKVWLGFGDTFICYGADDETSPGLWWRSGRYIRIRIRTKTEPLTLNRVEVLSSGYPIAPSSRWNSSDNEWDRLFPLLYRGLELCAHETWIDSPYYEQLMYTGDTRLHCLSNYASYTDTRLSRSAIELFDSSRPGSLEGLVAERYPSAWRQDSFTYALIWTWMVRDYMLWQNDLAFIREKTIGVRQMMERILAMRRKNGLLGPVPGWPFVDWVEQWNEGCGPGVREGDSSIINLHLVLSLQAAAELEIALGEKTLAARWNTIARQTMDTLLNRYWDNTSNLLLDSLDCDLYSEHVQALALLTGLLDDTQEKACLEALASGICKTKCSIYFSFYLLEAYACTDTVGLFFEKLAFWRGLPAQGFKSLPESPEPTRSDCHGWGAHPIYHSYASIAGIRPAAPGFQRIRIAPMPGHLEDISLSMPHPDGEISFAFEKRNGTVRFEINLPNGIPGELHWAGKTYCLANSQTVEIPEHGSLPSREQKGMAEREGFEPSVHR